MLEEGKPIIRVANFDGSYTNRELEELWALRSDIVVSTYGQFTPIAAEVFRIRAAYGADIIRKALLDAGYRNQGQSINNKSTTLVFTPIPIEGKSATAESHKEMLPYISFFNENQGVGWKLSIEGKTSSPLDKTLWDDSEGILRLVQYSLDKEYCLTAFALADPTQALKIAENKDKYKNSLVVYDFFKPYKASSQKLNEAYSIYRNSVLDRFDELFRTPGNQNREYFCNYSYNLTQEGPKKPSTAHSVLPIGLSFERAQVDTHLNKNKKALTPKSPSASRSIEAFNKFEKEAFNQLLTTAQSLSLHLFETERFTNNGRKKEIFVKDSEIFSFLLDNNQTNNKDALFVAVSKRQAEATK